MPSQRRDGRGPPLLALVSIVALVARAPCVHGMRLAWGVVNASGVLPWSFEAPPPACVLPVGAALLEGCAAVAGMEWPPGVVFVSRERLVVRHSGGVEIEAAGVAVEALGDTCVSRVVLLHACVCFCVPVYRRVIPCVSVCAFCFRGCAFRTRVA